MLRIQIRTILGSWIRIRIRVKDRIRIRIKVKSRIQIRIRIKSYADPQHWNTETERQETQK